MDRFRAGNGPGSVQKQSVQKTFVYKRKKTISYELLLRKLDKHQHFFTYS